MGDALRSIAIGTSGLAAALVAATVIAFTRGGIRDEVAGRPGVTARRAGAAAAWLIAFQAAHFTEELATGFYERFPEILGLAPWPIAFFVIFNVAWLAAWGFSARLVLAGRAPWPALAALWFLAIGGVLNGLVHPLLSLRVGGYFPGLWTSLLVGVAGLVLSARLRAATTR